MIFYLYPQSIQKMNSILRRCNLDKIIVLKDIRDKKKDCVKLKQQYQRGKNDMVDYLKEEFDLTLSEIQKTKKGEGKNGNTK